MVKKLNLSALAHTQESHLESTTGMNSSENNIVESSQQETQKKKGMISLKKSSDNTNANISEGGVSNTSTSQENDDTSKKAKVSLRGLKKPEVKTQENIISPTNTPDDTTKNTPIVNEIPAGKTTQNETENIVQEEVSQEATKKQDIIEKIESLNGTSIEESAQIISEEKNEEIISIIDGDTNCAIIKDDMSEIFSSYKGSFVEVVEEEKQPVVEEKNEVLIAKSHKVDTLETIEAVKNAPLGDEPGEKTQETQNEVQETVTGEFKNETQDITLQKAQQEQTKLTPLQKLAKYKKNKKVWLSGVMTMLVVSISTFAFLQGSNTKINVIESTQNPIIEENGNDTLSQNPVGEDIEITTENDNQIENIEIVKENDDNSIDNTQNNHRIDPKVQNFLLKKYKSK